MKKENTFSDRTLSIKDNKESKISIANENIRDFLCFMILFWTEILLSSKSRKSAISHCSLMSGKATMFSRTSVIRKNTLIIGMGSTQIDIGILTTDDCYCVSPAYTTYRIKGVNSFYLQEYLIELNPLLSVRYMITSARQGKAVNKEDLMKHLMTIHSENEQKEICQCFENLYSRLQIEKEMLSALQKQKAFLLQSMFI